jgi:Family of unknown function (DUF5372)
VTVTHPHHPLNGQRVAVVRVRRGVVPDLIVRTRDGLHFALAMDWTDYRAPSTTTPALPAPPLLAVDGLRQLAQYVAHVRADEQGAAAARRRL